MQRIDSSTNPSLMAQIQARCRENIRYFFLERKLHSLADYMIVFCSRFLRVKLPLTAFFIAVSILIFAPSPSLAQDSTINLPRFSVSNALKKIAAVLKGGLSKIPPAALAAAGKLQKVTNDGRKRFVAPFDVSGVPPTLSTIATSSIENIFWRPDVVSSIAGGSASPLQCSEFYLGLTDGVSGGLRVCELAQGIGFSFQTLLNAETTLCYMKALPTKKNLQSGAVLIENGKKKIPDGDFTKLFAPGPTLRKIRIHAPVIDQVNPVAVNLFIKVNSLSQNARANLFYRAEIYSCLENSTTVSGTTRVTVDTSGQLSIRTGDVRTPLTEGSMTTLISGYLRPSGSGLAWDLSKPRSIEINALQSETENFKSSIIITADNLLSIKRRNFFQSTVNEEYSTSQFSGGGALSFVFLAGALKASFIANGVTSPYSAAAEYRDTYYAAAPANDLLTKVNQYDLNGDPFFQSDPTIDSNTSTDSCDAMPDVALELNAASETLINSLAPCARNVLSGMDFCARSSLVNSALENFSNSCSM